VREEFVTVLEIFKNHEIDARIKNVFLANYVLLTTSGRRNFLHGIGVRGAQ